MLGYKPSTLAAKVDAAEACTGLARTRLVAMLAGFPTLLGVSSRQLASKWARLQEYGEGEAAGGLGYIDIDIYLASLLLPAASQLHASSCLQLRSTITLIQPATGH